MNENFKLQNFCMYNEWWFFSYFVNLIVKIIYDWNFNEILEKNDRFSNIIIIIIIIKHVKLFFYWKWFNFNLKCQTTISAHKYLYKKIFF